MDDVRLPDLETIRRFSIAVRSEHAPAEQVIAALEMDLDKLRQATGRRTARSATPSRTRSTRSTRTR